MKEILTVITALDFIYWAIARTPEWTLYIWIALGTLLIIDWMFGGVEDKGIFGRTRDYLIIKGHIFPTDKELADEKRQWQDN